VIVAATEMVMADVKAMREGDDVEFGQLKSDMITIESSHQRRASAGMKSISRWRR
jgi:hypothetical protein|tara:strand:- start:284 stop:448 length:165 start_codon:yes stop_codon:yes gene_type:complete